MITAEQLAEWKEHPVTREIFKGLKELKADIKDQLGNGATIGPDAEFTHASTSRSVGQIDGLNQLLNISFAEESSEEVVGNEGY